MGLEINNKRTGGSGNRASRSFFPEGRTYSPPDPIGQAVVSLAANVRSPRAASEEAEKILSAKKKNERAVTAMAIYHLEAKIITRGEGRSAVAAAAYIGCDRIYNDYDGVQHDYTRKQGLVWEKVFLPENAPAAWSDRSVLWNAVEESEKSKDSRLAREFVVALPVELKKDEWISLLSDFIKDNFVSDGMCADGAIHDTDGHNPHAHIMLTVRPLDERGNWQSKTEKEYLCIRNGEECGFTAAEFKTAQNEGWEKQYQYKVGKKKIYLPPSEAAAQEYERISKYPKSTKFGRQNPITERWNSDEQLVKWREAWAGIANRYLEQAGHEDRIDHRSFADRGIDEQPTIHEGVTARVLERKGIISERCELNRQIRKDNAHLRELKEDYNKLLEIFINAVPVIAEAMEALREKVIIISYHLRHIRPALKNQTEYLSALKSGLEQYNKLTEKIKAVISERKALVTERERTPVINILKRKKLSDRIDELTGQLEQLRSERSALLKNLSCDDVSKIKTSISNAEADLKKLNGQESGYSAELEAALAKYAVLCEQAKAYNLRELREARLAIRPEKEKNVENQLQSAYGKKFSRIALLKSMQEVSRLLNEEEEKQKVREESRLRDNQASEQQERKKRNRAI